MRTLTVTGHGSATAVPDSVVVRVTARHRGTGLAEALSGAESAREAVVAVAGDRLVATQDLSVWPAHDSQGEASGFEAQHALAIAAGDLEAANALLTRLADEVGDRLSVDGVQLVVSDVTAASGEAREAAFVDARAKAEHLVALAGGELDAVESVAEGLGGLGGAPFEVAHKAARVGLQPGESTVATALTVTWSFRLPHD